MKVHGLVVDSFQKGVYIGGVGDEISVQPGQVHEVAPVVRTVWRLG
jgi:hypothetical protein